MTKKFSILTLFIEMVYNLTHLAATSKNLKQRQVYRICWEVIFQEFKPGGSCPNDTWAVLWLKPWFIASYFTQSHPLGEKLQRVPHCIQYTSWNGPNLVYLLPIYLDIASTRWNCCIIKLLFQISRNFQYR